MSRPLTTRRGASLVAAAAVVLAAVGCAGDAATEAATVALPANAATKAAGTTAMAGTGTKAVGTTATAGTGASGSPSAAPSQTPAGPSGQPMPVGDIPGWHQIFADDFLTDVPVGGFSGCDPVRRICSGLPSDVASKWWAYPDGWPDTDQQGIYTPSKTISISDGMMRLDLHTENGVHMVAAPLPKIPGASGSEGGQVYGRYAIRFLVEQPTPGYKVAWLLWPDSENFPEDGEIDFPEGNLVGVINAYMHHMNGTSDMDQDAYQTSVRISSGWHTAVIEWTAQAVDFLLDGATIGTSTSRVPSTPMHWVIQSETDGVTPDSSTAVILIDWVAIYRPD
ncbi:MAG TPA: glycoside hydrolase family 16 protein [Actinocrinis sp.]|uniref:glycoside hydrolase family 16 protein n=1 Tax=Actinocrinis sp. TaxID=1920516 RepID=UPI002DDCBC9C|nr:glycoside hydrolase family 16 protein [Actinocrinis sp.]HEV3173235.1 glycoside hydrolase family 16 protein [Actinocrinis sp.]